jgi:nitroreductase
MGKEDVVDAMAEAAVLIRELVTRTRTVRKFDEKRLVKEQDLLELLNVARLGGAARNAQQLRYRLVTESEEREQIFPLLGWAGYLSDWPGPEPGQRPGAYILCLLDRERSSGRENEAHFDLGIASQNLLLAAAAQGIFGCRIGAFSPSKMANLFSLEARFHPLLVLALGYPAEKVRLEEVGSDGDIRYWRDDSGVHHVPKRSLDDILLSS